MNKSFVILGLVLLHVGELVFHESFLTVVSSIVLALYEPIYTWDISRCMNGFASRMLLLLEDEYKRTDKEASFIRYVGLMAPALLAVAFRFARRNATPVFKEIRAVGDFLIFCTMIDETLRTLALPSSTEAEKRTRMILGAQCLLLFYANTVRNASNLCFPMVDYLSWELLIIIAEIIRTMSVAYVISKYCSDLAGFVGHLWVHPLFMYSVYPAVVAFRFVTKCHAC